MKDFKDFQAIIDTRANGNISDFNYQVKQLDKYEIIKLIQYIKGGNYPSYYPKLHNLLAWLELAYE
jgi:hypothetical protein